MLNERVSSVEFVDAIDESLIEMRKTGGIWVDIFREFLQNDAKYVVLSFKNNEDRNSCKCSLTQFRNNNNVDLTWGNYGPGIKLYIAKP